MRPLRRARPGAWRPPAWSWLVGLVVAVAIAYIGRSLLLPLVLGLFGAYLLNPLVGRLQQRGIARVSAVALLFATMLGALALGLSLGLSTFRVDARRVVEQAPVLAHEIELAVDASGVEARRSWPLLSGLLPAPGEPGWLSRGINDRFGGDKGLADRAGAVLTLLILTPVFAFFLLRDGPPMVDRIIGRLHPRHIETSVAAWVEMDLIIGRYLRGLALESAAVGLLAGAGLWIVGVPFPLLLGLFAALLNPVPYIGVAVSLGVALLVALTAQMTIGSLGAVVVLFLTIRLIDDLILVPLTIGGSVHLHPLVVIVSIVIGEHALGVLGMVLAVPAVTVLKEVARLLLEHRRTLARATTPWMLVEEIRHHPF